MNNFKLTGIIILAVMVVGLLFAMPTLVKLFTPYSLPEQWIGPKSEVKLGLDLQGGMHLILKVDTKKALESRISSLATDLKGLMVSKRIHYTKVEPLPPDGLRVMVRESTDQNQITDLVKGEYPFLTEPSTSTQEGALTMDFKVKPDEAKRIQESAVSQALETIRNRIDQLGVSEPSIITEGKERINVQLPGISDPERAKKLLGETAILEFKLVDEEHSLNAALNGDIPPGSYIAYKKEGNEPLLLRQQTVLTGDRLEDARVKITSTYNEPYVAIAFDKEGARIFERITTENVGKRLAIILDGKVYSAPNIREPIAGGKAIIEGRFKMEEAKDLAIVLRAGSLPAPVTILEERTVGPSLGKDSIGKGLIATAIGGILVVLFMAIYYKASGLLANLALVCNLILIFAAMAVFKAVLTLPGIAGIVLTIGMAVDANILIFERMREEIRLGRTPKMVVEAGYKNALATVIDANITTLIAGLVLFQFGTGPVRGFAVTLNIGILSTLFTALVMCKWINEWIVNNKKIERFSI
jgi:preprotein translocase subunit SecD